MGGYTLNLDDLLKELDEASQELHVAGWERLSDAVDEARARLNHIAKHIDASRLNRKDE